MARASTLPDLSGLAWIEGDRFLTVHDAKTPEEDALPRVSVLQLPSGLDGILWQPLEIQFPEHKSDDFESIARIPGDSRFLLVESTEKQEEKPFARRIFLASIGTDQAQIEETIEWPVPTHNVEGSAVGQAGDLLFFLYAERAEGEGSTEIHYAELQLDPLGLGSFTSASTFTIPSGVLGTCPDPTGENARPVSAIEVDSQGVVYVASAEDPGDDNGPFRSAIYAVGHIVSAAEAAKIRLYDEPRQVAVLDGLKVESLAVRELPGQQPQIFVGFDDENYGGSMRPLQDASSD